MYRHFFSRALYCNLVILICISTGCIEKNSGYFIKVRVKNQPAPVKIYLKIYDGEKFSAIDSLLSDGDGNVEFRSDEPLAKGMYSAGTEGKNEVDFFIDNTGDQHFSVVFDPEYVQQTLSFKGTPENEAFVRHLKMMDGIRRQIRQLQMRMQQNLQYPDSVRAIKASARKLQVETEAKIHELEKQFPGSLLALYLKTSKDPAIPEPSVPFVTANREQLLQQYYYSQTVAHYFDNFDFSDNRLIKLPVLKQKMMYYFTQLLVPQPDTLIARLDQLLSGTSINPPVHLWSIKYLYNLFRESPFPGLTGISVYIAEKYIIANPGMFNDSAFVARIKTRVEKAKLNPVGSTVTNLVLQNPDGQTIELNKLRAPVTILYFFNPGCDACHAITDKLSAVYSVYRKKGLAVFAVYVDRNRDEWIKFIESKELDWVNVFDMEGTQGIEQKFDVNAIPMIYLLDKNKKVVGKDIPVEALESYLKSAGL